MTSLRGHSGFILITVLVVTMVGLLFGTGALLLFRYQCQQRIDRQHELEKVYAVRSVLTCLQTPLLEVPKLGKSFRYLTESERNLGVIVRPVEPIFPSDVERHFFMQRGDFPSSPAKLGGYNEALDYEYGTSEEGDFEMSNFYNGIRGLVFTGSTVTNGVKWWVNIGMRDTGGWLQEDFGRRYYFKVQNRYAKGTAPTNTRDLVRLCIIRNVTNQSHQVGCKHGWPLSPGERALVFESSSGIDRDHEGVMTISEYVCPAYGIVQTNSLLRLDDTKCPDVNYMGIQIASDLVSIFYVENFYLQGFTFSENVASLTPATYAYFSQGASVDAEGKIVKAPELRAVFEVEAHSNLRPSNEAYVDALTDFRVEPAYQYDVFLEHPTLITNRATVAQKIGEYSRGISAFTVLTYDTHGTENKGFRKDEREAERKRNGR